MRHTLKAVFNHRSDAQHVLKALLASGYASTNMALSRAPPTKRADGGCIAASGEDTESLGASAKRTFTRLFRSHHQQTIDRFGRFIRGAHVVTLTTGSELEVESAVGIFKRFGPVGIKDVDDELDHDSADVPAVATDSIGGETPHRTSYQPVAPDAVLMELPFVAEMSSVYPRGTEPGALQNRAHEDSHYFGTQNAEAPPTGNTFQETMGAAKQWDSMNNDGTGDAQPSPDSGSHDNDIEAYRYGTEMRTNDSYRYGSWDEVEPCLKKEWETRATGASTWDESKSAIRRGWSSPSSEIEDDRYFRAHWNAVYRNAIGKAGYDDRTPAYLYGSEARRSEKYRSHDWRDVEPHVEADWKARHPGQLSSWENFKDAVKHGWNRVNPDMDGRGTPRQSAPVSGSAGDSIGDDDRAAANRFGPDSIERKLS